MDNQDYKNYLATGAKSILTYCASERVSGEEKEVIVHAFTDELRNNIGNPEGLKDPSEITLSSSAKYLDKRLSQLRASKDASYSELAEGIELCDRLNAIVQSLKSRKMPLPQLKNHDIDECAKRFQKQQDEALSVDRITEADQRIDELIKQAQSQMKVRVCDAALKQIDDFDKEIELCKKRGIAIPATVNSNTANRRRIISNIQKQIKDRDVLYQDIANIDEQIGSIASKRKAPQDECDRIIRLCVAQKKNLEKCQRQGLAAPTLNCPNLDGLMAQYKHYLDMLFLDSEIVVGQNDYSRITSIDDFNEVCNKQEKNINRCTQNGWELPNIQVMNPGKIASAVSKNLHKEARKKRIKKKLLKVALISIAVLVGLAFGFYKYAHGKIRVPFDASYPVGKDKEIIVEELKEAGFTNIVEQEITSGWAKSGLVSRVEIDGRGSYHKGYYRKPDSTVVVTYSSNNRVNISSLIDNWKTQQAGDLVRALRRYGLNVLMVKTDSHDKENNRRVAAILIDDTPFTEGECYVSKAAEVVVKYNALKIKVAKPDDYIGKQYSEIVYTLKEQGFANIKLKRSDDLLLGWIHSEGEIKSITINGESAFSENQEFYFDDEIVIVVYTYDGKGCEDITIKEDE